MPVAVAGGAPVRHGRLLWQGRIQQVFLTIAQEVPYVQTKAQTVIQKKSQLKAGNIAVGNVFQQQRSITTIFPVVRETCQQAALHLRRALGRVQYGAAWLKKGRLAKYRQCQLRGPTGRMRGSALTGGPGQVNGQMHMPAQGQGSQIGRQVLRPVVHA